MQSQNRFNLLGHLYRHPESLESQATFMPSAAYRHTTGPNKVGRPKAHWAESCLVEASRRIVYLQSDAAPPHSSIDHGFFTIPTAAEIKTEHSSQPMVWMDNTHVHRRVSTVARNRASWVTVVHKPRGKTMWDRLGQTAGRRKLRRVYQKACPATRGYCYPM